MKYKIPLFELNIGPEEEAALMDCLRRKWISSGPATESFESEFAAMCGCAHAVAVTNCTSALHLALVLGGIGPSDEVICPSLTFVATANAVRYVGAEPVFADIIGKHDLTIDPDDIASKITPKTKAIMVMHHSGFACDMDRIMKIARLHGLMVIEDACHAPFSECNDGRKLGTIGDIGCFSFFSNKNISTGEGGMIVTNNEDYARRAKLLRSHGMTTMSYQRSQGHATTYDVIEHGYNYRMDDMRASMGLAQLARISEDYEKRAVARSIYESLLQDIPHLSVPFNNLNGYYSNYIFTVVVDDGAPTDRDQIRNSLASAGIQTSVHYPPVHLFTTYHNHHASLPKTEKVAEGLITLPMHGFLGEESVVEICNQIRKSL